MSSIKPHLYDSESWDDQDTSPTFERVRKQTGKAATLKDERRQRSKEWGRAINKEQKQRARTIKKP